VDGLVEHDRKGLETEGSGRTVLGEFRPLPLSHPQAHDPAFVIETRGARPAGRRERSRPGRKTGDQSERGGARHT
jgi:hypothetical protein